MARRAQTPAVSLAGPSYLAGVIKALEHEGGLSLEPGKDGGNVPLTFSKTWSLSDMPRDRDLVFEHFPDHIDPVCDITTSYTDHSGDSYEGVTIYEDPSTFSLYRLTWYCPGYCDDESDASGTLEAVWGLEESTAKALLAPLKQLWLLEIAQAVLRPAQQLLRETPLFDVALQDALKPFLAQNHSSISTSSQE